MSAAKLSTGGGTSAGPVSSFVLAAATLWQRELIRFFRQPSRVIGAFGTPLLFWILIGSGLGRSFQPAGGVEAGGHYLQYFFPGTLLLIILFTAIFSSFSLIEDRREGFLQAVLVSPVPRGSIVFGKILGGTTLAVLQGMLFTAIAPAAGIPVQAMSGVYVLLASILISLALTGLGFALAWPMESLQGFHGVMNLVLMPMWLLSGALFPESGASGWVRILMLLNPLTYALRLLRAALMPDQNSASVSTAIIVTAVFAVLTFTMSWIMICRPKTRPH